MRHAFLLPTKPTNLQCCPTNRGFKMLHKEQPGLLALNVDQLEAKATIEGPCRLEPSTVLNLLEPFTGMTLRLALQKNAGIDTAGMGQFRRLMQAPAGTTGPRAGAQWQCSETRGCLR